MPYDLGHLRPQYRARVANLLDLLNRLAVEEGVTEPPKPRKARKPARKRKGALGQGAAPGG